VDNQPHNEQEISSLIAAGENNHVEFKEAACRSRIKPTLDRSVIKPVLKAVASFLNTDGGTLLIGVQDDATVVGVEADYAALGTDGDWDGYQRYLTGKFKDSLSVRAACLPHIQISPVLVQGKIVCHIEVKPYLTELVSVREDDDEAIYVRAAGRSQKLSAKEAISYTAERQRQQSSQPQDDISDPSAYLRYVQQANEYVDPRGIRQTQRQVQVKLDQVYTRLVAELQKEQEQNSKVLEQERMALLKRTGDTNPKLEDAVEAHQRLVILGDPGAGKTTLLRYLAYQHATALQQGISTLEQLGAVRLPIYIRMAEYADAVSREPALALSTYLPRYYAAHECRAEGLERLFARWLAEGHCVILLDGLDEVTDAAQRSDLARRVEEFVREYVAAGNRFVLTSRPTGYDAARLSGDYAHYRVQDMSETEGAAFLQRWCYAVEQVQTPDVDPTPAAEREIKGIMAAIKNNPGVARLATNPLLLTLIALIHRANASLPTSRASLYKQAAETLIRRWEANPDQQAKAFMLTEREVAQVLGPLAYCMHANRPDGTVTASEAKQMIKPVLARLRGLEADDLAIEEAVDDFLRRVRESTGLFVERQTGQYGFMHLSFEEYFAARYILQKASTRATLIRRHLHDPRWEEVILLALGFLALDYPDEAAELLELAVLKQGEGADDLLSKPTDRYNDLFQADLFFALRAAADGALSAGRVLHKLVTRAAELYFSQESQTTHLHEQLASSLQPLKQGSSGEVLKKLCLDRLRDNADAGVRKCAAEMLEAWVTESTVVAALRKVLFNDPELEVCLAAAKSLWSNTNDFGLLDVLALLQSGQTRLEEVGTWLQANWAVIVTKPDTSGKALLQSDVTGYRWSSVELEVATKVVNTLTELSKDDTRREAWLIQLFFLLVLLQRERADELEINQRLRQMLLINRDFEIQAYAASALVAYSSDTEDEAVASWLLRCVREYNEDDNSWRSFWQESVLEWLYNFDKLPFFLTTMKEWWQSDMDGVVRQRALTALLLTYKDIYSSREDYDYETPVNQSLIQLMDSGDQFAVIGVMNLLADLATENYDPSVLIALLNSHENALVRYLAVDGLAYMNEEQVLDLDKDARTLCFDALEHEDDPDVRRELLLLLAEVVSEIGGQEVEALLKLLQHNASADVRERVTGILGSVFKYRTVVERGVLALVDTARKHPEADTRREALNALGSAFFDLESAEDGGSVLRGWRLKIEPHLPAILSTIMKVAVEDKEPQVRSSALALASRIGTFVTNFGGDEQAAKAVAKLLSESAVKDPDAGVRGWATLSLALHLPPDQKKTIRDLYMKLLSKDVSADVRGRAAMNYIASLVEEDELHGEDRATIMSLLRGEPRSNDQTTIVNLVRDDPSYQPQVVLSYLNLLVTPKRTVEDRELVEAVQQAIYKLIQIRYDVGESGKLVESRPYKKLYKILTTSASTSGDEAVCTKLKPRAAS